MNVLVLGGAGFIGRHVVAALMTAGHRVSVGSRHPERSRHRLPAAARTCDMYVAQHERLLDPAAWMPLVTGHDVVINCVGILRERWGAVRETYDRVHHRAPAALAQACRGYGMARLIHVSAQGLRADAQRIYHVQAARRGGVAWRGAS